ncbi:DUF2927 domain-containing protein [Methylophaga sp. OBS3]|uniref:DUF2927 domain-containing protein n=1 Tax=Methylophaga sp. OBS3 TaxID=2991934 RepID=UPI0022539A95|nr:DUF2927 domain-containing protein [Methylophaga sp. OBS3]MCX4190499.1 DUF2927 domain-containing protein [Methylophaga sp. OBS3]
MTHKNLSSWSLYFFKDFKAWHLLLSLLLTFCSVSLADEWQDKNYILDSFKRIALSSEYLDHTPQLRKWQSPIRFQFHHDVGDAELHEKLSNIHLTHLSTITGHQIEPVSNSHSANLQIIFTEESTILSYLGTRQHLSPELAKQLSRNSVCIANLTANQRGEIQHAVVLIPVNRARAHAKLLACIVEELTQVMGLPNDDAAVFPSIFNDLSHDDFLSGLDYILLKLLYHPALKPGMGEQESEAAIRQVMQGKAFQQWLEKAYHAVYEQGLYPLMGN